MKHICENCQKHDELDIIEIYGKVVGKTDSIAIKHDERGISIGIGINGKLYRLATQDIHPPIPLIKLIGAAMVFEVFAPLGIDDPADIADSDITLERLESGKVRISISVLRSRSAILDLD